MPYKIRQLILQPALDNLFRLKMTAKYNATYRFEFKEENASVSILTANCFNAEIKLINQKIFSNFKHKWHNWNHPHKRVVIKPELCTK